MPIRPPTSPANDNTFVFGSIIDKLLLGHSKYQNISHS